MNELAAVKLRPAIGVNHAAGDITASGDGVVERGNGDPGLHSGVDLPGPA